jgi:hypothetical protein
MGEEVFLDSILPHIQAHLERLWYNCKQPRALYARGSAILPIGQLVHQPWDIDFVLFIDGNEAHANNIVTNTTTNIVRSYSGLPPPDIRVILHNTNSPEALYALLVVSTEGRLFFGEDCRLPINFFQANYYSIFQYALRICKSRLKLFEKCHDSIEQQRRAPHLAKSVLRLGGLLRLQDGSFTRKPEKCAILLNKMHLHTAKSSALLLISLEAAIEQKTLIEACHFIINLVSGLFVNGQQKY